MQYHTIKIAHKLSILIKKTGTLNTTE